MQRNLQKNKKQINIQKWQFTHDTKLLNRVQTLREQSFLLSPDIYMKPIPDGRGKAIWQKSPLINHLSLQISKMMKERREGGISEYPNWALVSQLIVIP